MDKKIGHGMEAWMNGGFRIIDFLPNYPGAESKLNPKH